MSSLTAKVAIMTGASNVTNPWDNLDFPSQPRTENNRIFQGYASRPARRKHGNHVAIGNSTHLALCAGHAGTAARLPHASRRSACCRSQLVRVDLKYGEDASSHGVGSGLR